MKLVARAREMRILGELRASTEAELVAVYGRRRVGKTFLVRRFFEDELCFELTGMHQAPLDEQLVNFSIALAKASPTAPALSRPTSWQEAFQQLEAFLEGLGAHTPAGGKRVVFLDELPWLASRRSGFMRAFEHFWNTWAVERPWLVVVVCGSAASWMIQRLLRARGGLHNPVTRRVRLEPFTLAECQEYFQARGIPELGHYQMLELYMAMGGVPHYLKEVRRGESATQNIDRICFSRDGILRDEFTAIYASLFEHAERHERVVRALARRKCGLTRSEIIDATSLTSGGGTTTILEELEESGFISRTAQFGKHTRDAVYRLTDEYSLFYLTWIEEHRSTAESVWQVRRASPAARAWSGLAFEGVCLKHVQQIKAALGIGAVETTASAWTHRASTGAADSDAKGAQIDLLIDRRDQCINLCEMKFSEAPFVIDKRYAGELRDKREAFARITGTRKSLLTTMVTTYGVKRNAHSDELVAAEVSMGALFAG